MQERKGIKMEDTKKYVVYITETLQRKVVVEAKSLTEAEEKVQEAYKNEEITLDYNDYLQVDFDARNI